jgi:AcrR family transcriptional regulator
MADWKPSESEEQAGRSREDYLRTGLELLAESGPRALTAVRLAAELEATTGSFYWHFKNVAEFRRAVREYWRHVVVPEVIAEALKQAEADGGPAIDKLGPLVWQTGIYRYDDAMRRWAQEDAETANALQEADAWRGRVMTAMMGNTSTAADVTELIGAAWRGSSGMPDAKRRAKLIAMTTRALA